MNTRILETRKVITSKLQLEWQDADTRADWAFIRGMLSVLHLMEEDAGASDDLLFLYSLAGYRQSMEVQP